MVLRFDSDAHCRTRVLDVCVRFLKAIFHFYLDNAFLVFCPRIFSEQFLVQIEESVTPSKWRQKFSGLRRESQDVQGGAQGLCSREFSYPCIVDRVRGHEAWEFAVCPTKLGHEDSFSFLPGAINGHDP